MALVLLLGIFLIPIGTSSLRGLTHVLTCREPANVPFTIVIPESGPATILSSTTIERGEERGLCGGLRVNPSVGNEAPGRLRITLAITNETRFAWRGTVQLRVGDTTIPADIGRIAAGATGTDTLHDVRIDPGTHEIDAALLIGP